ncbi:MAG: polyamine ABC transporter substrate-binding protein [Pseudomonadota bacterium]
MTPSFAVRAAVLAMPMLMGAAGIATAQDSVNIANWTDYIGETTLADFEAETGIRPNYDVYDSNEVLETRLLAGRSGYDVVVPSDMPFLAQQVEAGVYQPLDRDLIPNLRHLDPDLMARASMADPGNAHAVIYQWGTNGFGYNVDAIAERMPDAPIESWAMIFDPEIVSRFADCGVTLLDSQDEMIPLVLHYLGLDPFTEDSADLAQAEALLTEIRPFIRYFHSSQYVNDLANGDICLAAGWSGDVIQAYYRALEAENGVDIEYTIPSEGTIIWFDMMAIPTDAPNPEAAHAFIDFVLRPDVMAGISDYVAYANAVPDSWPLMDQEIAGDDSIFPSAEVQDRLFPAETLSMPATRERTRLWTRVRTGV